jgi:2-iminobutanoate/2-iminopropanoate deaminase
MRDAIDDDRVPRPKGPYSQAIVAAGPMVFISGQLPLDPGTGRPIGGDFVQQATQVFTQLSHLLAAAGSDWSRVVKLTVVLADLAHFADFGDVSRNFLVAPFPARTTLQATLPPGVALEVDCIALVGDRIALVGSDA